MKPNCLFQKSFRYVAVWMAGLSFVGSSLTASAQETQALLYAEDYQTITSDGAWCWFSDPRAIYVDDKMYGGFVDRQGSIWAFCHDPATQNKQQCKLYDKLDYDDHANPSIMALPDTCQSVHYGVAGQAARLVLFRSWRYEEFTHLL